ncbi:MAG: hypothetical protein J0H25_15755, partial [Rhizobiales bacterium]|nr:hypothetical protein [Hyphomicrobiales bacterium]
TRASTCHLDRFFRAARLIFIDTDGMTIALTGRQNDCVWGEEAYAINFTCFGNGYRSFNSNCGIRRR